MLEVLEFIFQDFTHFIGTVILICVIGEALEGIVNVINKVLCKRYENWRE